MNVNAIVPKVSVVVPAFNSGPYLEKLVASLLRQSLPPGEFEAVFVDDGSTDTTPARLDELAAVHPHIRVLHTENSGWPSRPRNIGVAHARGSTSSSPTTTTGSAMRRWSVCTPAPPSTTPTSWSARWPGTAGRCPASCSAGTAPTRPWTTRR